MSKSRRYSPGALLVPKTIVAYRPRSNHLAFLNKHAYRPMLFPGGGTAFWTGQTDRGPSIAVCIANVCGTGCERSGIDRSTSWFSSESKMLHSV